MNRGVQHIYCMMHKCIMVKIVGKQKNVNLAKKLNQTKIGGIYKFCRNRRGKFIDFGEIGEIYNMHHWLRGMDAPGDEVSKVKLSSVMGLFVIYVYCMYILCRLVWSLSDNM